MDKKNITKRKNKSYADRDPHLTPLIEVAEKLNLPYSVVKKDYKNAIRKIRYFLIKNDYFRQ